MLATNTVAFFFSQDVHKIWYK